LPKNLGQKLSDLVILSLCCSLAGAGDAFINGFAGYDLVQHGLRVAPFTQHPA
jgi:hypothetical protein